MAVKVFEESSKHMVIADEAEELSGNP